MGRGEHMPRPLALGSLKAAVGLGQLEVPLTHHERQTGRKIPDDRPYSNGKKEVYGQRDELSSNIIFEIASDGRKILAQVWKDGKDEEAGFAILHQGEFWRTGAELREVLILEPGGGPPVDVGRRLDLGKQPPGFDLRWIGSDRLAISWLGRLAFLEIEGDGEPRHVFGSP